MIKQTLLIGAMIASMGQSLAGYDSATKLKLNFENLGPMKGQHYEGWNIVNGEALSTGRFSFSKNGSIYAVDESGQAIKKIGENGKATFKLSNKAAKASTFVLTIEPNGDKDLGPSSVHVMGGDFSQNKASLNTSHGSSLRTDFLSAAGQFIMAAPTGGTPNQGVWFFNPQTGSGSLDLPTLPQGWAYEGWIVNTSNNKKFSTGLFFDANSVDSDGAGIFAGELKLSFPNAPGQDIVKTPVTIDDGIHAIVISVEPYPDFDPAPYAIKPLMRKVELQAPGMSLLELDNISSMTLPSGHASIVK